MRRRFAFEEIWRDAVVSHLFVEDRLSRKASHSLLRTVIHQIEQYVPDFLRRSLMPSTVRLGPVEPGQRRIILEDGRSALTLVDSDNAVLCVPADWNVRDRTWVSMVVDRAPTNNGCLHFCLANGFCWYIMYGVFHDTFNSLRTSAKGVDGWWSEVVKFASIANMNYGPFRSGSWGVSKQEGLAETVATMTVDEPFFQECALRQQRLTNGREDSSSEAMLRMREFMGRLPSCVQSGPLVKFSRWKYLNEAWEFYKMEIWMLKYVLTKMGPDSDGVMAQAFSTNMFDEDAIKKMSEAREGIMAKAPHYIRDRLIDVMKMFAFITAVECSLYTRRTTTIKGPLELAEFEYNWFSKGGWVTPLDDMVKSSLYDRRNLRSVGIYLGAPDVARMNQNVKDCASMTLNMLTELGIRRSGQALQPPLSFYDVAVDDERHPGRRRYVVEAQYEALLGAEQLAADGGDHAAEIGLLLADLHWQRWMFPRVFFHTLQEEARSHEDSMGPGTQHLLRSLVARFADEKLAEDCHQFLRDAGRSKRSKRVRVGTCFSYLIDCGVLEARLPTTTYLDSAEVAFQGWRSSSSSPAGPPPSFHGPPRDWPIWMNKILDGKTSWPSPNVSGYCQSMLVWRRLIACHEIGALEKAADSWWSRLAEKHTVISSGHSWSTFIVLFVGR